MNQWIDQIYKSNNAPLTMQHSEQNAHIESFIEKSKVFFHGNAVENVIWKLAAILSQPLCVKIDPYKSQC